MTADSKKSATIATIATISGGDTTRAPIAPFQTAFPSQMESTLSSARVISLGLGLVLLGMVGFYEIDGLIVEDAGGSKLINAFYCTVITLTT